MCHERACTMKIVSFFLKLLLLCACLSICLFMCLCVCVFVSVFLYLSVSFCLCTCVCVSMCVCVLVFVCVRAQEHMCVHARVCLPQPLCGGQRTVFENLFSFSAMRVQEIILRLLRLGCRCDYPMNQLTSSRNGSLK